ncbi:MAG: hypothetical protein KGI27_05660 [Thaumarchaeota archaeon]|nr:hypothetical protein [Nitrososphaerota archaeon]
MALPPFEISLNGSSVYPSYTVTRGQNIVIFVDVTSKQPYLVSLNAHLQNTEVLPIGLTIHLPVTHVTTPASNIPLTIDVSDNTSIGLFPVVVDASYYNDTIEHVGFQAGFNLNIIK